MPYLDHAGARLFYTVDGPDNAPAIIFSNSLGTDHTMWQPQADALAGRFRVVRYDTRGQAVPPRRAMPSPWSSLVAMSSPFSTSWALHKPRSAVCRWAA